MAAPAGYYPDPNPASPAGWLRWWDGNAWTSTTRGPGERTDPPYAGKPAPKPVVAEPPAGSQPTQPLPSDTQPTEQLPAQPSPSVQLPTVQLPTQEPLPQPAEPPSQQPYFPTPYATPTPPVGAPPTGQQPWGAGQQSGQPPWAVGQQPGQQPWGTPQQPWGTPQQPWVTAAPSAPPAWGFGPPAAFDPKADLAREHASGRWARIGLVVFGVAGIGAFVFGAHIGIEFHYAFRSFDRRLNKANANGLPTPTFPRIRGEYYSYLFQLPVIIGLVGFLIWQHRAATLARRAGIPAKRSPGLGVGGWFIPVCNLWFPYQALRDMLPENDKGRSLAAYFWTSFVLADLVYIAAVICAFTGLKDTAFVVSGVAGLLLAVGVVIGYRYIGVVESSHARLTGD